MAANYPSNPSLDNKQSLKWCSRYPAGSAPRNLSATRRLPDQIASCKLRKIISARQETGPGGAAPHLQKKGKLCAKMFRETLKSIEKCAFHRTGTPASGSEVRGHLE